MRVTEAIKDETALRLVVEGTVSETGVEFFRALVNNLAVVMGTVGAWVTEYLPEPKRLRAHACWLTVREMDLERANIWRALESCGGKVSGESGAARLLGIPATTLNSRMKALKVERPED